jgi:hypothetical protein
MKMTMTTLGRMDPPIGGDGILVVKTHGNKSHVLHKARRRGIPIDAARGHIYTKSGTIHVMAYYELPHRAQGLHVKWWFAENLLRDEDKIDEMVEFLNNRLG